MNNLTTQSNTFFSKNEYAPLDPESSPIIIAYELRTPENLGAIIRTGANLGCRKIYFINKEVDFRLSKIKKSAASAYSKVEWEIIQHEDLDQIVPTDYTLTALETADSSENIFATKLPSKMALLIGNEVHGMPAEVLELCNKVVHIPMPGIIKSMNVAHATTTALFEWYRQRYF